MKLYDLVQRNGSDLLLLMFKAVTCEKRNKRTGIALIEHVSECAQINLTNRNLTAH